ncbi:MAG: type II toxin-antitoxin system RelE family toxin [Dehalococcoidia bacterium]
MAREYRIQLSKSAHRFHQRADPSLRHRLSTAIDELRADPRRAGVIALQGRLAGRFRYRVGDYRIVFEVHDDKLFVSVVSIAHRSAVYY